MKITVFKVQNGYIVERDEESLIFNRPKRYVVEKTKDMAKMVQKAVDDHEAYIKSLKEKNDGK